MSTTMWRLLPGQALHHRAWEDEYVVFNNLSGDTHLLDASAMQVLLAVPAAPAAEAAIVAQLRAALGLDDAEAADIPAILGDLQALFLIETVQC
ncbi:MAG: HPr-rel-A system PqqD family peptide chaperone [Telluria sp.]